MVCPGRPSCRRIFYYIFHLNGTAFRICAWTSSYVEDIQAKNNQKLDPSEVLTCSQDYQCPENTLCIANKCASSKCTRTSDCPSQEYQCVSNVPKEFEKTCQKMCDDNFGLFSTTCQVHQLCINQFCVTPRCHKGAQVNF